MEVLYKKLYGFKNTVIEYWVIYLISVVMNFLGEREVISGEQTFWQEMTDLNNSAVFILLLLMVLMVVYYLLLMGYPKNKGEYHPSSYLRLLMFYLNLCDIHAMRSVLPPCILRACTVHVPCILRACSVYVPCMFIPVKHSGTVLACLTAQMKHPRSVLCRAKWQAELFVPSVASKARALFCLNHFQFLN